MHQPILPAAGTADETFRADQFEPEMSRYTKVEAILLENVTHLGIAVGPEIRPVVQKWLQNSGG